jgi:hypothetical protein
MVLLLNVRIRWFIFGQSDISNRLACDYAEKKVIQFQSMLVVRLWSKYARKIFNIFFCC